MLRGIPLASIAASAVEGSLQFYHGRQKALDIRHIAQAVQKAQDVSRLARRIARLVTLCSALKAEILNPSAKAVESCSEEGWGGRAQYWKTAAVSSLRDWVKRAKYWVLEHATGVYRSVPERMAAEKAVEIVDFLIAGECSEAKDEEEVVKVLLGLILPFEGGEEEGQPGALTGTATSSSSSSSSSCSSSSSSSASASSSPSSYSSLPSAAKTVATPILVQHAGPLAEPSSTSHADELRALKEMMRQQQEKLQQQEKELQQQAKLQQQHAKLQQQHREEVERLRRENKKKASAAELLKLKKEVGAEDGGPGGQASALMPGKGKGQGWSEQEVQALQRGLARLEQRVDEHGEYFQVMVPNSPQAVQDEIDRNYQERKRKEERMRSEEFLQARRDLFGDLETSAAKSWTVDKVVAWLGGLELAPFKLPPGMLEQCREYGINGTALLELDHDGLKDLGVDKSLLRAKLLGLIKDL